MPCEIASSRANPQRVPASVNVRSPLLRKATFRKASFGKNDNSLRHSLPLNVV